MARVLSNLEDAQAMARLHPDTFEAPSDEELKELSSGDWVKICRNEERFWIAVTGVSDGYITGKVDNHLIYNRLKAGTEITFQDKHVYQILLKRDAV